MSYHPACRRRRGDPALLRQLRGEPAVAAVEQPASPIERAFAALTVATMLLISAYIVVM